MAGGQSWYILARSSTNPPLGFASAAAPSSIVLILAEARRFDTKAEADRMRRRFWVNRAAATVHGDLAWSIEQAIAPHPTTGAGSEFTCDNAGCPWHLADQTADEDDGCIGCGRALVPRDSIDGGTT